MKFSAKISATLLLSLMTASAWAASGSLKFINLTGETLNVTVNGASGVGVPIKENGLELSYRKIGIICFMHSSRCHTDFYVSNVLVGWAELNASTGELLDYAKYGDYDVIVNENETPLREVTFVRN